MATPLASKPNGWSTRLSSKRLSRKGFSLLEMLLVVVISSLALGSLSAFLVQSYRGMEAVNQPLRLQSSVETALQSLSQDMRRAGYHHFSAHPSYFQQSTLSVIWRDDLHQLGLIYQDPNQPSSSAYFHLVYTLEGNRLIACEKGSNKPLTLTSAAKSTRDSLCYSVFDPNALAVKQFSAHQEAYGSAVLWRITLQVVDSRNEQFVYTLTRTVVVNNYETQ